MTLFLIVDFADGHRSTIRCTSARSKTWMLRHSVLRLPVILFSKQHALPCHICKHVVGALTVSPQRLPVIPFKDFTTMVLFSCIRWHTVIEWGFSLHARRVLHLNCGTSEVVDACQSRVCEQVATISPALLHMYKTEDGMVFFCQANGIRISWVFSLGQLCNLKNEHHEFQQCPERQLLHV